MKSLQMAYRRVPNPHGAIPGASGKQIGRKQRKVKPGGEFAVVSAGDLHDNMYASKEKERQKERKHITRKQKKREGDEYTRDSAA
jgi:ribosomal protein RSM22 (predicted rRNA methylase)